MAISSSFRRFFLSLFSLYNVSCIPLMEVVTVLVSFVMFFHGSYGLSELILSLSGWMCVVSRAGVWEDSFDGGCDCFGEFCNVFPWFVWVVGVDFVVVGLDVCGVPGGCMGGHIRFSCQSSVCVWWLVYAGSCGSMCPLV